MGKNTLTDTLADVIATLPTTDLGALDAVQLMRRFDTKYVVPETWLPDLIASMGDYAHVLSVDGEAECRYDNLYYELPGDRFLQDHLRGKARRMKIRKRHYTSNDLAFLEVKERLPGGRTVKERIATSSNISQPLSAEEVAFLGTRLRNAEEHIEPRLSGGFYRTTVVDFEPHRTGDRGPQPQCRQVLGESQTPHCSKGLAVIEVKQPQSRPLQPHPTLAAEARQPAARASLARKTKREQIHRSSARKGWQHRGPRLPCDLSEAHGCTILGRGPASLTAP